MRGGVTVKCLRVKRIKWWAYLKRMERTKTVRKITEWNPTGQRSKGRLKNR
jgi:hypothetical protein